MAEVESEKYLKSVSEWLKCTTNKARDIIIDIGGITGHEVEIDKYTPLLKTIKDIEFPQEQAAPARDETIVEGPHTLTIDNTDTKKHTIVHSKKIYDAVEINGKYYANINDVGMVGEITRADGKKALQKLKLKTGSTDLYEPVGCEIGKEYNYLKVTGDKIEESDETFNKTTSGGNRKRSGPKKYNKKTMIRGGKKRAKRTRKQKRSKRV